MVRRPGRSKKLVLLARWRTERAGELRADFRRYYGCRYSEVERLSPAEAADLAFFLPNGSALKSAVDPALAWTRTDVLLALVANGVSGLGGGKPVVKLPTKSCAARCAGMDIDEIQQILNQPRKEVKRG